MEGIIDFFIKYNQLIATCSLIVLGIATIIVMVPSEWPRENG